MPGTLSRDCLFCLPGGIVRGSVLVYRFCERDRSLTQMTTRLPVKQLFAVKAPAIRRSRRSGSLQRTDAQPIRERS